MLLTQEQVWTAVEKGYEGMAQLQLDIAKRSRYGGPPSIRSKKQLRSLQLYANAAALEELRINISIEEDRKVVKILTAIKLITKDIRRWD